MSRWSWHEKNGVRKGVVRRKSDTLTAKQEEKIERDRRAREFVYAELLPAPHDWEPRAR